MAALLNRSQPLGNRFARRLFLLFVAGALIPLAVSDSLALHAVHGVLSSMNRASRERLTDQVSFQVLDRLLTGKTLLRSLPLQAPAPGQSPPGVGTVFDGLELLGPRGSVRWSSRPHPGLRAAWNVASAGRAEPVPRTIDDSGPGLPVTLRESKPLGRPPRILLAAMDGTQPRWIASMDPSFLWAPVSYAVADNAWSVRDSRGRLLFSAGRDQQSPFEADAGQRFSRQLFLSAEFGTHDWTFAQSAPRPVVRWLGWPLATWLVLVAVATLVGIALLTMLQLRRTLVPLVSLTQGTRRLAAGDMSTRVAVRSDDEIAELARSFNEMAARIGSQLDALKGMAAMDRAILSGASVEILAGKLLDQLRIHYPDARAALAWQDGHQGLRLTMSTDRQSRDLPLDARTMQAWEALAGASEGSVFDCRAHETPQGLEWLRDIVGGDRTCMVVLPVVENMRTRAVIALSSSRALPAGELQHASDLRDRMAVGLAARARELDLVHQATHDSLTGLLNRNGLHQRFDSLLAESTSVPVAVLFVDLDNFKDINDSRGHDVGDILLCQAAERILASVPGTTIVARQGGDEFVLLLPGSDTDSAQRLAEILVAALSRPFELSGSEHVIGASIGIALAPDHARTRDELLRCADIALYAAKAAGRGRATLFSAELDSMTRSRVERIAEFRQALDRHELVAHFQPRVRVGNHAIIAAEALVRWRHPQRGLVMPSEFVSLAEAAGLIHGLGAFMLDAACAQFAQWRAEGIELDHVSVNVSPEQLNSGDFVELVRGVLSKHGVPGSALELEVTENLLIGNQPFAFHQINSLRDLGVRIALDDFGTGYSSMAALRSLPFDVMKIDRSFVIDLGVEQSALPMIQAIVTLAKASGLTLVAEGVENELQARYLTDLGCDELQGFLFGRPMPAEQFGKRMDARRNVVATDPPCPAPEDCP